MVTRSYMLEKPVGPSAPKRFLDQKLIPAMIDATGAMEVAAMRIGQAATARPRQAATLAVAVGVLLGLLGLAWTRRARDR